MAAQARKSSRGTEGANLRAVNRTLEALRKGGRLEPCDDAAAALSRHLARALDRVDGAVYPAQTASLARAQLATLRTLRGMDELDQDDGTIAALLAELQTEVGNTEDTK